MRIPHRLLALLLFGSGCLALMYEVLWQREFALVFGSAGPATAVVLAAYFAGLGAGSLLGGRWATRVRRPLVAYAVLEAVIALGALLVPWALTGLEQLYPWLYAPLAERPAVFLAVRAFLAFVILFPATASMGATLPLLGAAVDEGRKQLGQTAGWLYVVNTLGAAAGALAVPFVLLPRLGLAATTYVCAGGSLLIAAVAWRAGRGAVAPAPAPAPAPDQSPPRAPRTILLAAFLSGFAIFALQVLWNRAFAQVHENSIYSFAVIAATVILALALGAQLARIGLRRGHPPRRLLGLAWCLGGLVVLLSPPLFLGLTNRLDYLASGAGWLSDARSLMGLAAVVVLLPCALLGVGLPALFERAGQQFGTDTGRGLGAVLASNIGGAVTGALAAGFLLPGLLGLWGALLWVGLLLGTGGLALLGMRTGPASGRRTILVLAALVLAAVIPLRHVVLPRVRVEVGQRERVLEVTEGHHGIVAVVESPGSRRLKLNNHYGLGGTAATGDERMQTHLPLLAHPQPRRVAFLGLGTAISAGAVQDHPVEHITAIELVPEVVAAAQVHFRIENRAVLTDPRVDLVLDDARNVLRGTRQTFDVIVGDLVVPWREGEGALLTQEQFAAGRAALADGGLYCQWLPLFQLSPEEFSIIVRTFLTVFPEAYLCRGDFSPTEPAVALLGGRGWRPDPAVVAARLAAMSPDPANPHLLTPLTFWMHWIGRVTADALPLRDSRLNTEDRPWVQLLGPLRHAGADATRTFTGRRWQAWLDGLPGAVAGEGTVASGRRAGAQFGEALLSLTEGDRAGFERARQELTDLLPEELRRVLLP